jgi:hypothetical protein
MFQAYHISGILHRFSIDYTLSHPLETLFYCFIAFAGAYYRVAHKMILLLNVKQHVCYGGTLNHADGVLHGDSTRGLMIYHVGTKTVCTARCCNSRQRELTVEKTAKPVLLLVKMKSPAAIQRLFMFISG